MSFMRSSIPQFKLNSLHSKLVQRDEQGSTSSVVPGGGSGSGACAELRILGGSAIVEVGDGLRRIECEHGRWCFGCGTSSSFSRGRHGEWDLLF